MEYIYAAMLIHKAGKKVDESTVTKVLESAGIKADTGRVKALVAALADVDIDQAIKEAAIPMSGPVMAAAPAAEKKEEKKEEKKVDEAQAAAGLGALFG